MSTETTTVTIGEATTVTVTANTGPRGPSGDAAGGVSDGDKGDITVSGSGTTWTIGPGAVDSTKVAADVATQAELDIEATTRSAADTALDGRLDTIEADYLQAADIAGLQSTTEKGAADGYAGLDATGVVPDGQLPAGLTRDSELTAAITAALNGVLDGAPAALDTLNELAASIGDDADFAGTVTAALAGKQTASAELTILAGLTSTTLGRTLLQLASSAAGRTALGVVIGTDVQAWSSTLDTLAALTTTTIGRNLLTAADAAAARTLLSVYSTSQVDTAISNATSGLALDSAVVHNTGAETVAGVKTFSSSPVVPDGSFAIAKTTGLQTALDAKAPTASPTFTGTVSGVTKSMVGLGNVDNTADTAKPVSTAQQTALDAKVAKATFPVVLTYAISDETTALTTGTAKLTVRVPFAFTLTTVRASLNSASSSGNPTFDINEGGTSVLSTKLTVDQGELTSTTAATPAVISDSAIADDALITFDIDVAGTGAAGAKVTLIGTRVVA